MIQRASPGLPAGEKFTPQIKSAERYSLRECTARLGYAEHELESCLLWVACGTADVAGRKSGVWVLVEGKLAGDGRHWSG